MQQSEPEAKPLKTLLGENPPQVVVGSKQEQKSVSYISITCFYCLFMSFLFKQNDTILKYAKLKPFYDLSFIKCLAKKDLF